MTRGLLLSSFWVTMAVLVGAGTNHGAPPNCQSCNCTDGVQAWLYVSYDVNGAPTFGNPTVLKAWDANNPTVFGAVTPTAQWSSNNPLTYVFAPTCSQNNNQKGTTTCKFLYYNTTWPPTCALQANQPPQAKGGYYLPVTFDPNSINYTVGIVTTNYTCGPQPIPQ